MGRQSPSNENRSSGTLARKKKKKKKKNRARKQPRRRRKPKGRVCRVCGELRPKGSFGRVGDEVFECEKCRKRIPKTERRRKRLEREIRHAWSRYYISEWHQEMLLDLVIEEEPEVSDLAWLVLQASYIRTARKGRTSHVRREWPELHARLMEHEFIPAPPWDPEPDELDLVEEPDWREPGDWADRGGPYTDLLGREAGDDFDPDSPASQHLEWLIATGRWFP